MVRRNLLNYQLKSLLLLSLLLLLLGDKISGIITIRRATTDNRGLEINLLIGETENSPEIKQTFDLIG
ncbi:uncharacterized protein DC041_0001469 [Schistosoma bovis]|uniref:Uncharacterized protein n=1 Tax=Schistosoma bovis TaxID=6184 RepID=A0A430QDB3_SCHBO|nr:uncharacterized protein DC041_0001469 [Schistosoma bovis]